MLWVVVISCLLAAEVGALPPGEWSPRPGAQAGSPPAPLSHLLVDLNGAWRVFNANHSVHVAARVPGSIYTDLLTAGILGDPYFRFNDVTYRWVAKEYWTYIRQFEVEEHIGKYAIVRLDLQGLDTVAQVYLNGHRVAATNNMFRHYSFDVKSLLNVGQQNVIKVTFDSPITYAAQEAAAYQYNVPPNCPPSTQNGECHFNFIRKEASSFSWDWGPAFPTVGIWKSISLRAFSGVAISAVSVTPTSGCARCGTWNLTGTVDFDLDGSVDKLTGSLGLTVPGVVNQTLLIELQPNHTSHSFSIAIPKDTEVKLWWPNGYGDQALYDLLVTFNWGHVSLNQTKRFGFRTVRLVQQPVKGSAGLSFYFEVNGRQMFMKGSNWIPADSFQERITASYLHNLLTSARDANMNILRVWGGGVYESDLFYDLADELGIMIWQDLMFACALYPTNSEFLANIREEVTQQVRRLTHHPAIAIWAANNENEVSLAENKFNTKQNYSLYYRDYIKLYIDTIRPIVVTEDPSRPFVSSSPSNGLETEKKGWVATDPQSTQYGDKHYYNYTEDGWDWRVYPVGRFVSEYGVQSWCSMETLRPVAIHDDLSMGSQFVEHRQHREQGNLNLLKEVVSHFHLPNISTPYERFAYYIYLTQINQAMAIKTETELYRRSQSSEVRGQGYTMGALYWQLNDIWQAPTWASLEYGGKWKMLHYYARRFFNATLVSPFVNGSMLEVYLVKDHPSGRPRSASSRSASSLGVRRQAGVWPDLNMNRILDTRTEEEKDGGPMTAGGHLVISCYRWDRLEPIKSWRVAYDETSETAARIFAKNLDSLLKEAGCPSMQHCLLTFDLDSKSGTANVLYLSYFKNVIGLQDAKIKVTGVHQIESSTYHIELITSNIAPFVWLEADGIHGRFSDNGFTMVSPTASVQFISWDNGTTVEQLRRSLHITTLMDAYGK